MRNVNTPAPVYLHPAAATNPHTIRAIERATRRFACPDHTDPRRRVRLVPVSYTHLTLPTNREV